MNLDFVKKNSNYFIFGLIGLGLLSVLLIIGQIIMSNYKLTKVEKELQNEKQSSSVLKAQLSESKAELSKYKFIPTLKIGEIAACIESTGMAKVQNGHDTILCSYNRNFVTVNGKVDIEVPIGKTISCPSSVLVNGYEMPVKVSGLDSNKFQCLAEK